MDVVTCDAAGEEDGDVAFPGVEQQSEDAGEFPGIARDIGGADIAAADLADVRAAEGLDDEQTEGDRAQ